MMPLVRVLQAMPQVMSWLRLVLVAPVVWVPLVTVWWMVLVLVVLMDGLVGCFGGEGVVVDGSWRVPLPLLAEAWWFVGLPVVVALVASDAGGCRWRC